MRLADGRLVEVATCPCRSMMHPRGDWMCDLSAGHDGDHASRAIAPGDFVWWYDPGRSRGAALTYPERER